MIDSFVQALQLKNPKLSDHSMVHNFLGAMENPFRTHKLWKGCEDGDVDEAMDCLEKKILSDDKVYQSIVSNMGQSWEQMDASFEKKKYCLEFLQPSVRIQTYSSNPKALNVARCFQDFLQPAAAYTETSLESLKLTSCFSARLQTSAKTSPSKAIHPRRELGLRQGMTTDHHIPPVSSLIIIYPPSPPPLQHLDVKRSLAMHPALTLARRLLDRMDHVRAPQEKLECIFR
jgi:hypothetical protein